MPPSKQQPPVRLIVAGLRLYRGMTPRAVAAFMGISVQAVWKHEDRVKKEIDQWMRERELQDPNEA